MSCCARRISASLQLSVAIREVSSPRRLGISEAPTKHNLPDTSPTRIRAVERSDSVESQPRASRSGAFGNFEALLFRDCSQSSVGAGKVDKGLLRGKVGHFLSLLLTGPAFLSDFLASLVA